MKKQTPHKQIKALDAEIARLQNSLPKLELKEFENFQNYYKQFIF